jgi:hypothetical protein
VLHWSELYPFDYFYRKKYNIPFGSPEHRATNFILMVADLYEEDMIQEYKDSLKEKEETEAGIESSGIKMSKKEMDYEYENLDLNQFNDKK